MPPIPLSLRSYHTAAFQAEHGVTAATHSQHPWTPKLLALDQCTPRGGIDLYPLLCEVTTPFLWPAWELVLQGYPDKQFRDYIVRGIRYGFRIGFDHSRATNFTSKRRNMASAYEHTEVIESYLTNEVQLGHIFGPFERHAIPPVHVSGFGVIPKSHKWRLIVDLSSPDGSSINDGIDRATCSLSYVTVDDIAQVALQLGRGALIAKTDIKHAYRQVPVHPEDRSLLAMCWRGQVFVDSRLPFGLRSAPLIFSAVADALEWIASQRTVNSTRIFHYIDDFVVVGPPRSDACASSLLALTQTCDNLGVLIAPEKARQHTSQCWASRSIPSRWCCIYLTTSSSKWCTHSPRGGGEGLVPAEIWSR